MLNLLVPSALVMLVDLAGFCIPVDSAERLPFKVTLLLGYTVYLLLATDLLPPFRDSTPMLGERDERRGGGEERGRRGEGDERRERRGERDERKERRGMRGEERREEG